MPRYVIASVDEVGEGESKRFTVHGRDIAVFNVNGDFLAISDRCPHEGASLCRGRRVGLAEAADPDDLRLSRQGEFIRCPWHGWEFDLRTGKSWCDPARVRARTYEIGLASGSEVSEGEFEVQTFDVSVEGRYLVLSV